MAAILSLLWKSRRLIAYALVVAALVGLLFLYGHRRYAAGEAAGRAHVQAAWDDQQAAQAKAVEAQARAVAAQIEADREAARKVEDGLREKISAADAAGRSLSQRLRDYQARRCGGTVPAATGDASQPAGTIGGAARDEEVERLSDSTWAACAKDGVRLDKIEEWRKSVSR